MLTCAICSTSAIAISWDALSPRMPSARKRGGGQEQDERPYPQDYTLQECHVSSSCEIHKTCP